MKQRFLLLCLLTIVAGSTYAQPNKNFARRIDQAAALFRSNPGGFDTLFTASFLKQVPNAQLTAISAQYFESSGTVTHWRFIDSSKAWSAKVRLFFSKGFSVDMSISVEATGKHLIQGLLLGPPTPQ